MSVHERSLPVRNGGGSLPQQRTLALSPVYPCMLISCIILMQQVAEDTRLAQQQKLLKDRDAQAKRLRYHKNDEVVQPPDLKRGGTQCKYHLFLSHVSRASRRHAPLRPAPFLAAQR